jgi:hypothetical protein
LYKVCSAIHILDDTNIHLHFPNFQPFFVGLIRDLGFDELNCGIQNKYNHSWVEEAFQAKKFKPIDHHSHPLLLQSNMKRLVGVFYRLVHHHNQRGRYKTKLDKISIWVI